MTIAVCLKQVPAREWQPRVDEAGRWVRENDAGYELNEPDGYALEEALRLREQHGGDVLVISAGPARVQHVLREALARGADRAIHVMGDALDRADAALVADALAGPIRAEACDLVLTGLQSDDQGHGQTGVLLAQRLGVPHATIVVQTQVTGRTVRVRRELEAGWFQWVTMPLPALLTIQGGINQLRYATLKGTMAARRMEIRQVASQTGPAPWLEIVRLAAPVRAKAITRLTGTPEAVAAELVQRLTDDARIL